MKIQTELIKKIKSIVNAEVVLAHLGFRIVRKTSKELRGPCKVHGGDNPTAFRFNLENKTWCCYTHHCEQNFDRDLIGLVQGVLSNSFTEAVQVLASLSGIDLTNKEVIVEQILKISQQQEVLTEIAQSKSRKVMKNICSEDILNSFSGKRSSYFNQRGFSEELLDFFEIGGFVDTQGIFRDTIPVRDEDGYLITISARRIDSDLNPKYLLIENLKKGVTLYNLHVAKYYTGLDRVLILVEGFVDVWRLVSLGFYNVVAAMGTDLTLEQVCLLWKYAETIVLLLDPDPAGRKAVERIVPLLKKGALVKVINLPDGVDPKYFSSSDAKNYLEEFICYDTRN